MAGKTPGAGLRTVTNVHANLGLGSCLPSTACRRQALGVLRTTADRMRARRKTDGRVWQRELVDSVFDGLRPRAALWAMPRGNG